MEPATDNVNPNHVLLLIGAGIAALIVAALALSAVRRDHYAEPGTPDATVATYLAAIFDRDHQAAVTHWTEEISAECSRADLSRAWIPENVRAVLVATRVDGNTAQVDVEMTEASGGLLFEHEFQETFWLTRTGEGWLISEIPWPLYACSERIDP